MYFLVAGLLSIKIEFREFRRRTSLLSSWPLEVEKMFLFRVTLLGPRGQPPIFKQLHALHNERAYLVRQLACAPPIGLQSANHRPSIRIRKNKRLSPWVSPIAQRFVAACMLFFPKHSTRQKLTHLPRVSFSTLNLDSVCTKWKHLWLRQKWIHTWRMLKRND